MCREAGGKDGEGEESQRYEKGKVYVLSVNEN